MTAHMRALLSAVLVASAAQAACNQDSAASNDGRETHMGDIRAAPAASAESAAGDAVGAPSAGTSGMSPPPASTGTGAPAHPAEPSRKTP